MAHVTKAVRTLRTPLVVLAAALPLAACISFGAKPPPFLLTLDAAATPPVGRDQSSAGLQPITVEVPVAPQALATARVPVQSGPTSIAYVPKAEWAEPPARLFARLMADTLTARTGRVVLSGVQAVNDPGARLGGELRRFGIDAATHEAVVTFDASLIRVSTRGTVDKRRFEARVPVTAIDADSVGAPLNAAANQVAAEVADWIGR